MKTRTAIITGITGQDGSYLAEFLLSKNYKVVGIVRKQSNKVFLKNVLNEVEWETGEVTDPNFVNEIIKKYQPVEVYNFASVSNVFSPWDNLSELVNLTALAPINFLDSIIKYSPSTKLFQACSSEMFGSQQTGPQTEQTIFNPRNPYGYSKAFVFDMFKKARNEKKIFAVSGILYNHESPRRGENFLTRKVTIALSKIKLRQQDCLEIGNLSMQRDWGYAKEYVEAMWMMLQSDTPNDYILATGKLHSVREFIQASAKKLGMEITWEGSGQFEVGKDQNGKVIVKIDPKFYRTNDVSNIYGDISKIKKELNWEPKISFETLVDLMTDADYNNLNMTKQNESSFSMTVTNSFKEKYTHKKTEYVKCPLCGKHSDYELVKTGYPDVPARNVICKGCGLIRIDPRMSQADYDEFYEKDFFEYLNPFTRPHYVNTIEKTTDPNFITESEKYTIPFILPFVKEGGKVLDIGAGFGQILYLLKKLKKTEIFGIEPDPGSRKLAKDKIGLDLSADKVEDFLKAEITKNNKYDYIHLEQVFEHLLQPLETLKDISKVLNKEGVLYIGVPGMYNYAVAPDRFFELAHTYGYTPHVLKIFADQSGMKIIRIKDPFASNLEVLMAKKDSNYKEEDFEKLKYGKNWKVTRNRILGRRYYFLVRTKIKNILVNLFGENVKNLIKRLLSV